MDSVPCGDVVETVEHFVIECGGVRAIRERYRIDGSNHCGKGAV